MVINENNGGLPHLKPEMKPSPKSQVRNIFRNRRLSFASRTNEMECPPNPRLLGEEVPARNTPMIQSNLTASHNKEVLSLGTGEVG